MRTAALVVVLALVGGACAGGAGSARPEPTVRATSVPVATPTATSSPTATPEPTGTPVPSVAVVGTVVSAVTGDPVPGAVITAGAATVRSDASGAFRLEAPLGSEATVRRPVWHDTTFTVEGPGAVAIVMEPVIVRGLRVSRPVAGDPVRFDELLSLAEASTVNALVFDTKDEADVVQYDTEVDLAHTIGAVDPAYDPAELLARAEAAGLYTITRIVTFEDGAWARARPDAVLVGEWIDAADPANWAYPLALANEACALGFDEIQFDYVRFPSGANAERAWDRVPATEAERVAAIAGFLGAARDMLHPQGCGVSAAIFGIVMSSADDERLGQTPETVSAVVDAVSPMVYPSHYSPGWLGFADPNDHPGPVVAHALDTGGVRLAAGSLLRPWIQGFSYNGAQVQAQIAEAEHRGAGWIVWNAFGEYREGWLPPA